MLWSCLTALFGNSGVPARSVGMWGLATVVLAPWVAELAFRGIFLGWLRQRMSDGKAMLVGALVFGLLYCRFFDKPWPGALVQTFCLVLDGIQTGRLFIRHGSLGPQ